MSTWLQSSCNVGSAATSRIHGEPHKKGMTTADHLLVQGQGEGGKRRTADVFEVSHGALRGMHKKTARIQRCWPLALIPVICCSSSGGFCLGSVLETADLALDLGDALLGVENLAI